MHSRHIIRSIDDVHETLTCRHGAPRPTATTHPPTTTTATTHTTHTHTHAHMHTHTQTTTSASAPRVLRLYRRTVSTSSQCQPERK